jgi:hypothetical protein
MAIFRPQYIKPGIPTHGAKEWTTFPSSQPVRKRLVCYLFLAQGSKLAKDELLPVLEYLHHRTGPSIDVFCAGYSRLSDDDAEQSISTDVLKVAGQVWRYSAEIFNSERASLESGSKWTYSGENELLISERTITGGNPLIILEDLFSPNLTKVISCNLDLMVRDKAIPSVRGFLEQLAQLAEQFWKEADQKDVPLNRLSNQFGLLLVRSNLFDAVLALLPEKLRSFYSSAKHAAVRDLTK